MTYSASIADLRATCVDTILKGAKPPGIRLRADEILE